MISLLLAARFIVLVALLAAAALLVWSAVGFPQRAGVHAGDPDVD